MVVHTFNKTPPIVVSIGATTSRPAARRMSSNGKNGLCTICPVHATRRSRPDLGRKPGLILCHHFECGSDHTTADVWCSQRESPPPKLETERIRASGADLSPIGISPWSLQSSNDAMCRRRASFAQGIGTESFAHRERKSKLRGVTQHVRLSGAGGAGILPPRARFVRR
jgi:hypothetical protein